MCGGSSPEPKPSIRNSRLQDSERCSETVPPTAAEDGLSIASGLTMHRASWWRPPLGIADGPEQLPRCRGSPRHARPATAEKTEAMLQNLILTKTVHHLPSICGQNSFLSATLEVYCFISPKNSSSETILVYFTVDVEKSPEHHWRCSA